MSLYDLNKDVLVKLVSQIREDTLKEKRFIYAVSYYNEWAGDSLGILGVFRDIKTLKKAMKEQEWLDRPKEEIKNEINKLISEGKCYQSEDSYINICYICKKILV